MTALAQQLALVSTAMVHAPSPSESRRIGTIAMFVRAFDRNEGRPLPADWRTRVSA